MTDLESWFDWWLSVNMITPVLLVWHTKPCNQVYQVRQLDSTSHHSLFFFRVTKFPKKNEMKIEKVFTFHSLCSGWSDVKILLIICFKEQVEWNVSWYLWFMCYSAINISTNFILGTSEFQMYSIIYWFMK